MAERTVWQLSLKATVLVDLPSLMSMRTMSLLVPEMPTWREWTNFQTWSALECLIRSGSCRTPWGL